MGGYFTRGNCQHIKDLKKVFKMDVEVMEYYEKRRREFREAQEAYDNQEG